MPVPRRKKQSQTVVSLTDQISGQLEGARTMSGDRLLPLMELARRWGWSRSKLWRLVDTGQIPHIRIGARRDVHFRERDVEAWLQAHTIGAAKPPAPAGKPSRSFAEECGLSREEAEVFL